MNSYLKTYTFIHIIDIKRLDYIWLRDSTFVTLESVELLLDSYSKIHCDQG